ncbi:hypothetical protein MP228_012317 [Amoeboaphelidium protococcarum]|nr:hypothetical protein MP228_012317 [Amoeboaphelidium protococcarum]
MEVIATVRRDRRPSQVNNNNNVNSDGVNSKSQAQSSKKPAVSKSEWLSKIKSVKVSKQDMNALVLNYLIIEGYKDAAINFQKESGFNAVQDSMLSQIDARTSIRSMVQSGHIREAIELTNELDPEILDQDPKLYFHLMIQMLIEMIRQVKNDGDIERVLEFAAEECVPKAVENPTLLEHLEAAMTLLAYPNQEGNEKNPVGYLLSMNQRHKVASELNAALLSSQSLEREAKLTSLIRLCGFVENKIATQQAPPQSKDVQAEFPKLKDLLLDDLKNESAISGAKSPQVMSPKDVDMNKAAPSQEDEDMDI